MDEIRNLYEAVAAARSDAAASPRTRRLLAGGRTKIAKKVAEEATEVCLEAVADRRRGVIEESVDLLYNLAVLWVDTGVSLDDICKEMGRRRVALGLAEKLPKPGAPAAARVPSAVKKTKPKKRPKRTPKPKTKSAKRRLAVLPVVEATV